MTWRIRRARILFVSCLVLFFFWVVSFAFTKVIKDIHLFVDIRINTGTKIPTVSDSPCLPRKLALRAVVGLEKY